MKKPKIEIQTAYLGPYNYAADVYIGARRMITRDALQTESAARAWAEEWCRTVGAALMEKGTDAEFRRKKLAKLLNATAVRLKQPKCTCDQQDTDPNCPRYKAGWRVGSDMVCSVPPKEKGK